MGRITSDSRSLRVLPLSAHSCGQGLPKTGCKNVKLWLVEPSELAASYFIEKPGSGESPIVFDGSFRYAQDFGRFLIGPAAKILQFDNFGLNRVFLGEFVQR